eukprot:maker-scaffold_5-snap-gene-13.3-mRNA-1 protein AED:0.02 eAED:0.02 QI:0/0/0.5/0.5/0/0/2/148/553
MKRDKCGRHHIKKVQTTNSNMEMPAEEGGYDSKNDEDHRSNAKSFSNGEISDYETQNQLVEDGSSEDDQSQYSDETGYSEPNEGRRMFFKQDPYFYDHSEIDDETDGPSIEEVESKSQDKARRALESSANRRKQKSLESSRQDRFHTLKLVKELEKGYKNEINELKDFLQDVQKKYARKKKEVTSFKSENRKKELEIRSLNIDITNLKQVASEKVEENIDLRSELKKITKSVEIKDEDLKLKIHQITEFHGSLSSMKKSLEEVNMSKNSLEADILELRKEHETVISQFKECKDQVALLEKEKDKLILETTKKSKDIAELKLEEQNLLKKVENITFSKEEADADVVVLKEKIDKLKKDGLSRKNETDSLRNQVEGLKLGLLKKETEIAKHLEEKEKVASELEETKEAMSLMAENLKKKSEELLKLADLEDKLKVTQDELKMAKEKKEELETKVEVFQSEKTVSFKEDSKVEGSPSDQKTIALLEATNLKLTNQIKEQREMFVKFQRKSKHKRKKTKQDSIATTLGNWVLVLLAGFYYLLQLLFSKKIEEEKVQT